MAAVTIYSDFGAQENKVFHCFHCFPIFCPEVMGPDAMILVFWMLNFKPTFSLSSFTFIKRFFSFSLSAIKVVSSAYLRLLIFFPATLIPACASSSPPFGLEIGMADLKKSSYISFSLFRLGRRPGLRNLWVRHILVTKIHRIARNTNNWA